MNKRFDRDDWHQCDIDRYDKLSADIERNEAAGINAGYTECMKNARFDIVAYYLYGGQ